MNDDMLGCSDDGEEEQEINIFEKINELEDEMPINLIEVVNENVSTHSSESKRRIIQESNMSVKDDSVNLAQPLTKPVH
jgi:hypothetical protein